MQQRADYDLSSRGFTVWWWTSSRYYIPQDQDQMVPSQPVQSNGSRRTSLLWTIRGALNWPSISIANPKVYQRTSNRPTHPRRNSPFTNIQRSQEPTIPWPSHATRALYLLLCKQLHLSTSFRKRDAWNTLSRACYSATSVDAAFQGKVDCSGLVEFRFDW